MLTDLITPVMITFNEDVNIGRTVPKLLWANRVVVVDSGSTDRTVEILRQWAQVEIYHHPLENLARQWNFALAQVRTPWALTLDADYELSEALMAEMFDLVPKDTIVGYSTNFVYCIQGRRLRGSLYPERTVLFRKDRATHYMDGHTQRVLLDGEVRRLKSCIYHDDRKPLSRWLMSQQLYARDEAAHLSMCSRKELSRADRLRLLVWPAPLFVLAYVLFVKRCILDGWPGWLYALERTIAEMLLALELVQRRLSHASASSSVERP